MPTQQEILNIRKPQPRFDVLECIAKRFSPRIFNNQQIPQDDMDRIFEAARLAPSGRNFQPWIYYWMRQGSKAYEDMKTCLPERNGWALTAPVFILTAYNPEDPVDGVNKWAAYDLGQANMSLILQAQELGYYARQIGSFDAEKAQQIFQISSPNKALVLIAMGKIGSDEDYAKADQIIIDKELARSERKTNIATELK
jgi:nitroreductase